MANYRLTDSDSHVTSQHSEISVPRSIKFIFFCHSKGAVKTEFYLGRVLDICGNGLSDWFLGKNNFGRNRVVVKDCSGRTFSMDFSKPINLNYFL